MKPDVFHRGPDVALNPGAGRSVAAGQYLAIACGGTGGHLFPGVAVAEELRRRGCRVTLFVSAKAVDRQGVEGLRDVSVVELPAVGWQLRRAPGFAHGFLRSLLRARRIFRNERPLAVLAMGGFVSAPPLLAARARGVPTFLHESNTIPGRANRWLSWVVTQAFTGFPGAGARLNARQVHCTGTPVRAVFRPREPADCRRALGLQPDRPVILIAGGSQGARGMNHLVMESLPMLRAALPDVQWLHLTGQADAETVRAAYGAAGCQGRVVPFLREMDLALGAATAAISRAGASALAELAAMRVPAILIPFPAATDNHQFHNARAYEQTGAARMLEQTQATPAALTEALVELARPTPAREAMVAALAHWHRPDAAAQIAERMLRVCLPEPGRRPARAAAPPALNFPPRPVKAES